MISSAYSRFLQACISFLTIKIQITTANMIIAVLQG